ncbi:uncharacterized protein L203_101993 [Cryptococcus depauperatus CBS 7841]|uniref:GST N-terminal domain-containing protein n=1 Tax=Cryptococcus depauperatus CBS 7841 TaxID=1295531 RepID=A0AAJ8LZW6_9TREE
MSQQRDFPKAVLYSWPSSVWSIVPQLCLYEKGYSEDEYIIKYNFNPSYLKINIHGTIPTLVVPILETTGIDVDTKYRSLKDTVSICDFLDQARSAHSSNTSSNKPAPTLGSATIDAKVTSDAIIDLIHLPAVDPNFIAIAALNAQELKEKASQRPGKSLSARREALQKYITEARESVSQPSVTAKEGSLTYNQKIIQFLEEKLKVNEEVWEIYNGTAGQEKEEQFYQVSNKAWSENLPGVLEKLEEMIEGPFTMGDQLSLADLHAISWLARIISIAGGKPVADGIDAISTKTGKPIEPKLKKFWESWLERESFQKVLVPACVAFAEMNSMNLKKRREPFVLIDQLWFPIDQLLPNDGAP